MPQGPHRWLRVSVIAEIWSCVSKETLSERDGLSVSNHLLLAFQFLSLSTSPLSTASQVILMGIIDKQVCN